MSDRWRWSAFLSFVVAFGLSAVPAWAQTCAPAWSAAQVYTAGNQASLNGINYTANFWTQGQNPSRVAERVAASPGRATAAAAVAEPEAEEERAPPPGSPRRSTRAACRPA